MPTKKYEIEDPMSGPRPAEFREQIYDPQDECERLDTNGDGFVSFDEYDGPELLFRELPRSPARRRHP